MNQALTEKVLSVTLNKILTDIIMSLLSGIMEIKDPHDIKPRGQKQLLFNIKNNCCKHKEH